MRQCIKPALDLARSEVAAEAGHRSGVAGLGRTFASACSLLACTLAIPLWAGEHGAAKTPHESRVSGEAQAGSAIPESPLSEVRTCWNLRFSSSPDLQEGRVGLADLYVPVGPQDVLSERATEPQASPEKLAATLPLSVSGPLRPAIVVVHGGGWMAGDKWALGSYSQRLAELGCVVLNINYRLAPAAKFPAQVDDVREALLYLVEHAEQLRIDTDRIGLFGYSAGGHLSALVGVMADETREVQATSSDWAIDDPRWSRMPTIAAVCAGGPPCDLRDIPLDSEALAFFLSGTRRQYPELYVAASPAAHVSPGDPPVQLIHGEKDLIVPIQSSEKFAAALAAVGVPVVLSVIENQGHIVTLMHPRTQQQVAAFFVAEFFTEKPLKQPQ